MPTLAELTEEQLLATAEALEEQLAGLEGNIASRVPGLRARPEEEQWIKKAKRALRAIDAQLRTRWPEMYGQGEGT